MKAKHFFTAYLIFINFGFVLAQNTKEQTKLMNNNIAIDKILLKVFESGDVTPLDGIISPDFINHTAGGDDRIGIENLRTMVRGFHANFKPNKIEIVRQLVDNEYVADWVKFIGENPKMIIEGIEMTRYKDEKAIEHWFFPYSQR